MLIAKFLRLENDDDDDARLHYPGIFGLHLINGYGEA